jgi:hypothetical protein
MVVTFTATQVAGCRRPRAGPGYRSGRTALSNCNFLPAAAEALLQPDAALDVVMSTLAIHHLPPQHRPTALRRLLSREFAINQTWCVAAAIAADLIAWLQIHVLDGESARRAGNGCATALLHTAARLTHGQRRRWLRIPTSWSWAEQITAAFTRITAIPAPG